MRKFWLVAFAFCVSIASMAQGKREYSGFFDSYYYKGIQNLNFTLNGGLTFYHGDLNGLSMKPDVGFGLGVNYKIWPRVMFGGEFHYLRISSDDNQTNRNISFSSTNYEFIAYGRFFLSDDIVRVAADRTRPPKFLKTYVIAGLGVLSYNPTAQFTKPFPPTDSIYNYTENGGGLGFIIPVGLGFSWRISNRFSLVTEVAYRKTFTDMLDEVSKRGNPKSKDGYVLLDFKLQFSPWAPKKKKAARTTPPAEYTGPKGTETWKNKKPEPVKNDTYQLPSEEQPSENTEENTGEENPDQENTGEENQEKQEEGTEELK